MNSGWTAKLGTPAFTGRDASGVYHFPGFGEDTLEVLEARGVTAIGVDTLSLDNGPSTTFVVHTKWLGADHYGMENLANLDKIPAHGATAIVGVIPWEEGSGGTGARAGYLLSSPQSSVSAASVCGTPLAASARPVTGGFSFGTNARGAWLAVGAASAGAAAIARRAATAADFRICGRTLPPVPRIGQGHAKTGPICFRA